MVKKWRKLKLLTMVILLFFSFSICVRAISVGDIYSEKLQESALPDNFNFTVNNTCSHHKYFKQATARQDGAFATCTVGVFIDDLRSNTNKKFIDIYDSDGEFIEELSFETTSDIAIELTEKTLNIYLYSELISYDLDSKDVSYFTTERYEAFNSGYVETLRQDKFTVGEWTYSYKSTILGHTKLMRSNGVEKQTLLETQGTKITEMKYVVVDIFFFIFVFVLIKFVRKKRWNTTRDGSVSCD